MCTCPANQHGWHVSVLRTNMGATRLVTRIGEGGVRRVSYELVRFSILKEVRQRGFPIPKEVRETERDSAGAGASGRAVPPASPRAPRARARAPDRAWTQAPAATARERVSLPQNVDEASSTFHSASSTFHSAARAHGPASRPSGRRTCGAPRRTASAWFRACACTTAASASAAAPARSCVAAPARSWPAAGRRAAAPRSTCQAEGDLRGAQTAEGFVSPPPSLLLPLPMSLLYTPSVDKGVCKAESDRAAVVPRLAGAPRGPRAPGRAAPEPARARRPPAPHRLVRAR